MRKLKCLIAIFLTAAMASAGQVFTGKQAHKLLDGAVMGGSSMLDKAKVEVIDMNDTHKRNIKVIMLRENGKDFNETYVASYDVDGNFIDGMLVAQKGDVGHFRTAHDNEYVWFVPQGEATVTITSDSVFVTRIYNLEMKPLSKTYLRHTEKVTFKYCLQPDGSFVQLKPAIETYQIEGNIETNADGTKTELAPTKKTPISAEHNTLSMNVMTLLYAPVSASVKTMEAWTEMGLIFKQRMNMTGIPDCDLWSANYYKANISNILTQGDGRNMVWLYQHHSEEAPSYMLSVLLIGHDSNVPSNVVEAFNKLGKAAGRLQDKAARKWWKDLIK